MAKHLTSNDIKTVVSLIDTWEGKLAWDALCDAAAPLIRTRPTRQTLSSHNTIKEAFGHKKTQIKTGFTSSKRPASLNIAEQRISRLENENHRLKAENAELLLRFIKWQYNAYKHGISKDKLDAALPTIDRDSSENV
ncbi:hypothetical protein [Pseudomonas sp. GL-B-16]|uniref:hypothetical protein n=1 Tax=Pseudomonas sp. GL-B-16 TaxID=2832373 RepID=UPI001CC04F1F|nr:hypothetical protein [Pseudomonas sp. GL-B-16]